MDFDALYDRWITETNYSGHTDAAISFLEFLIKEQKKE